MKTENRSDYRKMAKVGVVQDGLPTTISIALEITKDYALRPFRRGDALIFRFGTIERLGMINDSSKHEEAEQYHYCQAKVRLEVGSPKREIVDDERADLCSVKLLTSILPYTR